MIPLAKEGLEFINADPEQVIDYLGSLERSKLQVNPSNLKVYLDGKTMMLSVMNKNVKDYPIRKSFFYKLLKWYSFPLNQLYRLSN